MLPAPLLLPGKALPPHPRWTLLGFPPPMSHSQRALGLWRNIGIMLGASGTPPVSWAGQSLSGRRLGWPGPRLALPSVVMAFQARHLNAKRCHSSR